MFEGFASGAEANFSEIAKTSLELYDKELSEDYSPDAHDSELWEDFSAQSLVKRGGLELHTLGAKEKATLKSIHMTDANIEKCTVASDGTFHLNCVNQEYKDARHPETGVLYVEKVVVIDNVRICGVFPEFSSVFETLLPESLRAGSESAQFNYLNRQLSEAVKDNPRLRANFTDRQLAMIEDGKKPAGFTWHHNEELCKMQLVRFDEHSATRHTGGNSIWSDGT